MLRKKLTFKITFNQIFSTNNSKIYILPLIAIYIKIQTK
jgi:hypothetical protein